MAVFVSGLPPVAYSHSRQCEEEGGKSCCKRLLIRRMQLGRCSCWQPLQGPAHARAQNNLPKAATEASCSPCKAQVQLDANTASSSRKSSTKALASMLPPRLCPCQHAPTSLCQPLTPRRRPKVQHKHPDLPDDYLGLGRGILQVPSVHSAVSRGRAASASAISPSRTLLRKRAVLVLFSPAPLIKQQQAVGRMGNRGDQSTAVHHGSSMHQLPLFRRPLEHAAWQLMQHGCD